MGKHLQRRDSSFQFQSNHPGCLWGGILHILDYHHWHNVKKRLPHRKHGRGRHARSDGSPKSILKDDDVIEVPEYFDQELEPFLVEQANTTSVPTNRRSGKAQVKVLVSTEMSEEESKNYWKDSFPLKPQLHRIKSIHHSETSDYNLGDINEKGTDRASIPNNGADYTMRNVWTMDSEDEFEKNQISQQQASFSEKRDRVKITSEKQNASRTKQLNQDMSSTPPKEHVDILEMFKVNKRMFAEMLRGRNFRQNGLRNFNIKEVGLTKSRSFPVADLSRPQNSKPSTPRHKQIESFPKKEKLLSGNQSTKIILVESESNYRKSTPSISDDGPSSELKRESSFSSLDSSQDSKHQGWNQLVINRFNAIKKKIKLAFKENKKGHNSNAVKAVSPSVQSDRKEKEMPESLEITIDQEFDGVNDRVPAITRISSINASLERYTQLFENSFNREAKSKSFKQTSEMKILKSGQSSRSFRRNLSLPDIELFCSLFSDASQENSNPEMPIKKIVEKNTNNGIHADPVVCMPVSTEIFEPPDFLGTELQNDSKSDMDCLDGLTIMADDERTTGANDLGEDVAESTISERRHHQELDINCKLDDGRDIAYVGHVTHLETYSPDNQTSSQELLVPKGTDLNHECSLIAELKLSADQPNRSAVIHVTIGNLYKTFNNHHVRSESDNINEADFNYVRYILELSGLIEKESLGTDQSIGQPLDPSLFKGVINSDHQLLFDLVNESLLDIDERSVTYFPKAFSFNRHIRPLVTGQRLLDEVWARISWYLSLGQRLNQTLDDVMSQDLAKGDGWMNLQFDSECVALELEDSILDQLLDELLSS